MKINTLRCEPFHLQRKNRGGGVQELGPHGPFAPLVLTLKSDDELCKKTTDTNPERTRAKAGFTLDASRVTPLLSTGAASRPLVEHRCVTRPA